MKRISIKYLSIICVLTLIPAFTAGCKDDPVRGEDDPGIEWPDLTSEEDVIETIRLVYQNFNNSTQSDLMGHYAAILYDDPNNVYDYVWNMQPYDVAEYGAVLLREEDIAGTWYILDNSIALTLNISSGSWGEAADVCDECLQTVRTYTIAITIDHRGEMMSLYGGEMRLNLVIGPNLQAPGTWAIYVASDLPKIGV